MNMKVKRQLIGKWGLNEKHFQILINKAKNIDFYLHILINFIKFFIIYGVVGL